MREGTMRSGRLGKVLAAVVVAAHVPFSQGTPNLWGCQNTLINAIDLLVDASAHRILPATVQCAQERGWFPPNAITSGVLTWNFHVPFLCAEMIAQSIKRILLAMGSISNGVAICGEIAPINKLQAGASNAIFAASSAFLAIAADMADASSYCDDQHDLGGFNGLQCWIMVTDTMFQLISAAKFIDTAITSVESIDMVRSMSAETGAAPAPIKNAAAAPAPVANAASASTTAPAPILGIGGDPSIFGNTAPVERRLSGGDNFVSEHPAEWLKAREELLRAFNVTGFEGAASYESPEEKLQRRERLLAKAKEDGMAAVFTEAFKKMSQKLSQVADSRGDRDEPLQV